MIFDKETKMLDTVTRLGHGLDVVFFVYAPWIEVGFGVLAMCAILEFVMEKK